MTPAQLASARVKGHLIGPAVLVLAIFATVRTDRFVFIIAAIIFYIAINAWFVVSKGLAIDRAQNEKNQTQID